MKKTKNPLKISTLELYEHIDELDNAMNNAKINAAYKSEFLNKDKRKTKQDKRHTVIFRLLKEEFGGNSPISETNIWRYLKIKNTSPSYLKEVKNGELSIRTAYEQMNKITGNKKPKPKIANLEPINFQELDNQLSKINKQLDNLNVKETNCSDSRLRKIDTNLYEIRKKLQTITTYRVLNEIDET